MKAAWLDSKQNINIRDTENPKVDLVNNILIKIQYCGICGSDLAKYFVRNLGYPVLMGHEITGIVIKGPKELLNKPVTIFPKINCGQCKHCQEGKYNLCEHKFPIGSKNIGGFAEYISVPERAVLDISKLNNQQLGVLVEPLSNAFHCASLIRNVENKNIAIVGMGAMGNLIKLVLKLYYDKDITGITRDTETEILADRFDCVIECSGKSGGLTKAIDLCKSEGTIIQFGIIYPEELNNNLQFDKLIRKELAMKGSFDFNTIDWKNAYNLILKHKDKFSELIGNIYKLEDINKAFKEKLHNNKKFIIQISE